MNFSTFLKVLDVVVGMRDAGKGNQRDAAPSGTDLTQTAVPRRFAEQIETRLTNVVVAALKEAFDRDHARLELERTHLEEQRRRAEETMRLELRRQVADREFGRLRLIAGTAVVGWITSVVLLVLRLGAISALSRVVLVTASLLHLGALASALIAQARMGGYTLAGDHPSETREAPAAALCFLIAGLALSAVSLLL